jgi:hypothetical protein
VDTHTGESTLVTKQPQPILALKPDTRHEVLWVSTTSATVHAWPLHATDSEGSCSNENVRASEPLSPEKVPLAPRKISQNLLTMSRASKGRPISAKSQQQSQQQQQQQQQDRCGADAVCVVPGHAPLVRYAVFDDRRHVLTQDADGCVGLWDVVAGKQVKHFAVGSV